jgi:hypothetical protein
MAMKNNFRLEFCRTKACVAAVRGSMTPASFLTVERSIRVVTALDLPVPTAPPFSIRWPYADLILRTIGRRAPANSKIKPIESCSWPAKLIDERFCGCRKSRGTLQECGI